MGTEGSLRQLKGYLVQKAQQSFMENWPLPLPAWFVPAMGSATCLQSETASVCCGQKGRAAPKEGHTAPRSIRPVTGIYLQTTHSDSPLNYQR